MKKLIIITMISVFACSLIYGQTMKIAYLDTDRIMEESQATKDAQKIFTAESEQWERELQQIDRELERLMSEFETRRLTYTEEAKARAQERIDAKRQERRRFIDSIFGESGKAMQRNAELLEPIMKHLKDTIEKIALDNDYVIIFDAIGGGILYANPDFDITDLVIEGIDKAFGN